MSLDDRLPDPKLDEVIDVEPGQRWTHRVTRCRLRLFHDVTNRIPVALVTDLGSANPGLSVTNAAEFIWRALARRLDTTRFTIVEHYPPERCGPRDDTFDLVKVLPNGEPDWTHLGEDGFLALVCPPRRPPD